MAARLSVLRPISDRASRDTLPFTGAFPPLTGVRRVRVRPHAIVLRKARTELCQASRDNQKMRDVRFSRSRYVAAVWLACALFTVRVVHAQSAPPVPAGPLTLEQVLALVEAHSESVAIARSGVRSAEADQVRARSALLPQLSGSASYDRALASEFSGVFDTTPSAPPCADFAPNPQASLSARVGELERAYDCGAPAANVLGDATSPTTGPFGDLEDLPFGRKNTWRASLAFTQNLYSGGRNGAQADMATAGHDTAEIGVLTARAQLQLDATQAYYDAVLSGRLVEIAEATLQQATATLEQTEAGLRAGTQPEFEVLRARVNRDSQTPLVIRQRANREIALLRLKQLLDLPASYDLQLADRLGGETLPPPPSFATQIAAIERSLQPSATQPVAVQAQLPLPQRSAVAQVESRVRINEASLRLTEAQRMPAVSLNSTYSRIAYPSGVFPTFDRSNWTVGASMQVPILTGGRQRGDEAAARAGVDSAKLRLQQTRELAELDTRSAWAELVAARAAWESTAGTVQQATRAYEIAEVRFRAGVSTQLELSDARLLLQQAEVNRTQAARDLQVARAHVALLPDLPLAAGAGGAASPAGGAAVSAPASGAAAQGATQGQAGQFGTGMTPPASQAGTR